MGRFFFGRFLLQGRLTSFLPMGVFYWLSCPELPSKAKLSSSSSAEAATMRVCEIAGRDLFKKDGIITVIHDRLREGRRISSVDVLKAPDHISGSVGSLPNVAGLLVSFESKLPSGSIVMQQVGNTAPVDVISGVRASALR